MYLHAQSDDIGKMITDISSWYKRLGTRRIVYVILKSELYSGPQWELIKLGLRLKLVNIIDLFYNVLVTVNTFFFSEIFKFFTFGNIAPRRVPFHQCLAIALTRFDKWLQNLGHDLKNLKTAFFFFFEVLDSNAMDFWTNNRKYHLSTKTTQIWS